MESNIYGCCILIAFTITYKRSLRYMELHNSEPSFWHHSTSFMKLCSCCSNYCWRTRATSNHSQFALVSQTCVEKNHGVLMSQKLIKIRFGPLRNDIAGYGHYWKDICRKFILVECKISWSFPCKCFESSQRMAELNGSMAQGSNLTLPGGHAVANGLTDIVKLAHVRPSWLQSVMCLLSR